MASTDRSHEPHRKALERQFCAQTLQIGSIPLSKARHKRLDTLFKQQKTLFPSETARMADDLKRRNGIAELISARIQAGLEPAGSQRGWARRGRISHKGWCKYEIEDREWMIQELEKRVGNKASGMASVSKPVTGEKMDEGDGMALKPTSWQTSWSEDEDEDDEEGGVAVEPVGENGNGGGVIATDVRPGVGVKSYWASDLVFR